MIINAWTCLLFLSSIDIHPPVAKKRLPVCMRVATAAHDANLNVGLVVSLAWEESGFTERSVSSAGAIGPFQVLPRYFCPSGRRAGCDLYKAGIDAILGWNRRYPKVADTLCHYNSGNRCYKSSRNYAGRIISRYRRIFRAEGPIRLFDHSEFAERLLVILGSHFSPR